MDEKTIKAAYITAEKLFDFNAAVQAPWLAKLYSKDGQDEFRELKQNGYDPYGLPMMLEVIDNHHRLPENTRQQLELNQAYQQLQTKGSIQLPKAFNQYYGETFTAILWERPEGQRIISDDQFGQPFYRDSPIWEQINETASLIEVTTAVLEELKRSNPQAQAMAAEKSYADYFLDRFAKWNAEREKAGQERNDHLELVKFKILGIIFSRGSTFGTALEIAWNVFGNTDIIKTAGRAYYLVNGRFEPKPPHFLPAVWLWNMLLHGARSKNFRELYLDTRGTIKIFNRHRFTGPFLDDNLLERAFAARFVDADLRRSPFQSVSESNWQMAKDNIDYVLVQLLHTS